MVVVPGPIASTPFVEQPVLREIVGRALRANQRFPGPVDLEHATGGAVIADSGFGADFLQGLEGMKRQVEVGFCVFQKWTFGAVRGVCQRRGYGKAKGVRSRCDRIWTSPLFVLAGKG